MAIYSDPEEMKIRQEDMRNRQEMKKLLKRGMKDFRKARRKKLYSPLKSKSYHA